MRRLRILALRLRSLLRPSHVERELDAELRYHLDRQIDELVASGETLENARRLALRDLGGVVVPGPDLAVHADLADAAGDELGVLRSEVEDQNCFWHGAKIAAKVFETPRRDHLLNSLC